MALSVTAVRRAEPADLPRIQQLEAAANRTFAPFSDVSAWGTPPTGADRAAHGILLVVGQPPVGFAHVIEIEGGHHLDALAVHPDHQRAGLGWSLLRAAFGMVVDAGGDHLTLTTYADVPWNGPWYERVGFVPVPEPLPLPLARLRQAERDQGWDHTGRRIAMRRALSDEPTPTPAVSVLPIRDGARGLEVFVQHRVATMDFVPNAVVFPGGRVDPGDDVLGAGLHLPPALVREHVAAWAATDQARFGAGEAGARTALATGLREVAEETGARPDPTTLLPWDNWITPIGGPKRFDVRFFLLPVRTPHLAAEFAHATTEARHSDWMPVGELEAAAETRALLLVAPTRVLVEELATYPTVEAAATARPRIVPMRHDMAPTPAHRPGR